MHLMGGDTNEIVNFRVQRIVAQQHTHKGEYGKAVELYKQIIAEKPEDLESRAQLATVYSRQKQHEAAIAEWQAVLEADPENTKFQDGLVNAYHKAGKMDIAIELAQRYIESEENGVHYARLARVYTAEKRVDDAIKAYEKAIQLSPR